MKITVKKLSELHKPAHNIRRHSEKQLTEYIRSIEMFGQVKPLVVAEDGEIIAGNGLYLCQFLRRRSGGCGRRTTTTSTTTTTSARFRRRGRWTITTLTMRMVLCPDFAMLGHME